MSHSSRVRGLKPSLAAVGHNASESHSSRVRGLKQRGRGEAGRRGPVALFTGAWIETVAGTSLRAYWQVALFTGAWTETQTNLRLFCCCQFYSVSFTRSKIETATSMSPVTRYVHRAERSMS